MTEFYSYITKENDRWDLISNQFYRTPTLYEEIIKANPTVKITPLLPAGINLKIPVLDQAETIQFELPPWKK